MSVDCNAYLPVTTETSDIADAVAILLGAKVTMKPLDGSMGTYVEATPGVNVEVKTYSFACADLDINAALQEKAYELALAAGVTEKTRTKSLGLVPSVSLDVESRDASIYVHLGSGPVRVAIAIRLAKFFGGRVVPQDSGAGKYEGKAFRYKRQAPVAGSDGKAYQRFQDALAALRPLSVADIKAAAKYAYHAKES